MSRATVCAPLLLFCLMGALVVAHATAGSAPSQFSAVLFVSDRDGTEAIYRTDTSGATPARLFEGAQPAWCGSNLAFVRSGDIYIAHPDGTDERQLTDTATSETHPTCSPDGTRLAFSRTETDGADIYLMGLTDHRETRLTTTGENAEPSWSLDGRQIAFAANGHIMVMTPNGTDLRALTRGSAVDGNPAWMGDSKVLFDRMIEGQSQSHLWMTGIGAGPGIQLTDGPGDQQEPSFVSLSTPGTLAIVFQARTSQGDYRIYAMSYDGSIVKQLTTGPGADTEPAVRPTPCECTRITASLRTSMTPALQRQKRFRLTIRSTLECSGGSTASGNCQGQISLAMAQGRMRFVRSSTQTRTRQVTISCTTKVCSPKTANTTTQVVSYAALSTHTELVVRQLCRRGKGSANVGKPAWYDVTVDQSGHPRLRRSLSDEPN